MNLDGGNYEGYNGATKIRWKEQINVVNPNNLV